MLLLERVQNRVLETWNFFMGIQKSEKSWKLSQKSWILIFLIYEVLLFVNGLFKVLQCSNPDSMLWKLVGFQNGKKDENSDFM